MEVPKTFKMMPSAHLRNFPIKGNLKRSLEAFDLSFLFCIFLFVYFFYFILNIFARVFIKKISYSFFHFLISQICFVAHFSQL